MTAFDQFDPFERRISTARRPDRTAGSAQDIAKLIAAVQKETKEAVFAMADSLTAVEAGVEVDLEVPGKEMGDGAEEHRHQPAQGGHDQAV
jgi:hypothetical protein